MHAFQKGFFSVILCASVRELYLQGSAPEEQAHVAAGGNQGNWKPKMNHALKGQAKEMPYWVFDALTGRVSRN